MWNRREWTSSFGKRWIDVQIDLLYGINIAICKVSSRKFSRLSIKDLRTEKKRSTSMVVQREKMYTAISAGFLISSLLIIRAQSKSPWFFWTTEFDKLSFFRVCQWTWSLIWLDFVLLKEGKSQEITSFFCHQMSTTSSKCGPSLMFLQLLSAFLQRG